MKSIDTGKEKVKKICEVLRKETLEPAKKEGEEIIAKAHIEAEKIIEKGNQDALKMQEEAKKKMEEEKNVFQASLNLAVKKSIDHLKEKVESALFNPALKALIADATEDPKVIVRLLEGIVTGIEKDGIEGDVKGIVSKSIDCHAINKELMKSVLNRLQSKSIEIAEIGGGVQVKMIDKNITIDLSNEGLKTLLASFVRDEFRGMIFATAV